MIQLIFMLLAANAIAQKQGNIWYFGEQAGLDFSSGTPVQITGGQTQFVGCPACHAEGSAVIADSAGTLLFYTDGETVWNAQHDVMPNGNDLTSSATATQSSLILPLPGSNTMFYLFTVDDFLINNLQRGFRYSVVDMCLNGGRGDVNEELKNILITGNVTEKLSATRHANGSDYWVVIHKWQSNAFHAYPFSASGVGPPVISNVGSVHPSGSGGIGASIGQMKISPDGSRLAICNGNSTPSILEYFDFDPATGVVSNAVALVPNTFWMYYGVAFSPDNSKLYAAVTMNGNGVYQFDLAAGGGTPAAVAASMTQVAFTNNYLGLQLAVDGKIYVARSPFSGQPNIGVINAPNLPGTACNYVDAAIVLTGALASHGFPSFVDSYDYSNGLVVCTTAIEEMSTYPRPMTNPVGNWLHLIMPTPGNAQVEIFDAYGRNVASYSNASTDQGYDVGHLYPGHYFVAIHMNGLRSNTRFVKE